MVKKLIIALLIVLSVVTYISSHNANTEDYKGNRVNALSV